MPHLTFKNTDYLIPLNQAKTLQMKDHECPNCGGASPEVISEGEFRCRFCDSVYYHEGMLQRKKAAEKKMAQARVQQARFEAQVEQARTTNRMSKRVLLVVVIALLAIFGFVGYMARKSMDQTNKMQEEMLKSLHQK
jgi:uncharacterized Zn finger protein (UPF0148 family)